MSHDTVPPYVEIYTDGGCDPNPGPGGWGAVLVSGRHSRELSGAEAHTTNNRMELLAAIEALRALNQPCNVQLFTDSQYLKKGILEWLPKWITRNWRRANGQPVENADLWRRLGQEAERHHVEWRWIRGHRGHPLNERADALATQAQRRLMAPAERQPSQDRTARALPHIDIYTRGCALGAPGPGGYAALLLDGAGRGKAVSGRLPATTNNIMELRAAIAALSALRGPSDVAIHTVSKYLYDGATQWLTQWERNRWQTRSGEPVKNRALWQELSRLMGDHQIVWRHVTAGEDPSSQRAAQLAHQEAEEMRAAQA